MKDCLMCMALGFIAGAIIVSNNHKAQQIVENGKKAVKEQVKKLTDSFFCIICQIYFFFINLSLKFLINMLLLLYGKFIL